MIYTVTLNPAIDHVVRLAGPLRPGAVNRAAGEEYLFGGKGVNVSAVLAALGWESVALGFVAGATGDWLERELAAAGLATDFVHLREGMTRINLKLRADCETELNCPGPAIPPAGMEALYAKLDGLRAGDVLVLAGSIPPSLPQDTYRRILDRLAGRGVLAAVDADGPRLAGALGGRPFVVKPNHHELGALAGRPLVGDADIAAAARQLQTAGAANVLVSMAGDGALLLDAQGRARRIGCPAGTVVNSVGAGDSMLAGFLAGWLETGDYGYALRLGTACGSATAFSLGLAKREEIGAALRAL